MSFRCWRSPTTKDAYRLSIASIIITILAAVAGILMFLSTGSSLALVFGLENCVDFLSSAVVLWRFFAPTISPEIEEMLNHREERASMAISFILILLGVMVIATAISDFMRGEESPTQLDEILAVSFFSVLIFGTLTGIKFHYSNKLESPSLYKDGLCSLIGTILAGTLFVNTMIIKEQSSLWWIDPVVSVLCGIGAMILGLYHVAQALGQGVPLFTSYWWSMPQGGETKTTPTGLRENTENPAIDDGELELKVDDEAAIV